MLPHKVVERRAASCKDRAHVWIFVIIPMHALGRILQARLPRILHIKLLLRDDRPANLGHHPQRRNPLVLCEVPLLRHGILAFALFQIHVKHMSVLDCCGLEAFVQRP